MPESIEEAMNYIKGYCNKHIKCEGGCRLYNQITKHCFLCDDIIPCDWEIEKEGKKDE